MEVRCSSCATEYEFDDALVSARGTSVKCTNCGHQFRVHPPPGMSQAVKSGALETWVVRDARGKETVFRSLRDLQQAIVKGQLDPKHEMSHAGAPFRALQDIYELQTFFSSARERPRKPAPRTLLGVGHEVDGRSTAPPPGPAAPATQDRITPVAGMPAVRAASQEAPQHSPERPPERSAEPTLDRRHETQRESAAQPAPRSPRPAPVARREPSPAPPAAAMPWQNLQGLHETDTLDLGRSSGAGSRWIALVVVLGGLALIAGTVGRKYLLGFVRPTVEAPQLDARVPTLIEQARAALARGDFESARAELAKASLLAEAEPTLTAAKARLELALAEPVWLEQQVMQALEAAADKQGSGARKSKGAKAAEAEAEAQRELEKKQLQLSLEDRLGKARAAVATARERSPDAIEVVRAQVDLLRLEQKLEQARALVAPLSATASDPDNAYSLGALDYAEGPSGYPSAIDRLRVAARPEEALGKARALLTHVLALSGDTAAASAELEKLATLAPRHRALPGLRELLDTSSEAAAAAAPARRETPPRRAAPPPRRSTTKKASASGSIDSQLTHAGSLHRQGDLGGAEKVYQGVLAKSPNNVAALSGLGDIARQRRAYATASAFYDQVLKLEPRNVAALMARADLHWHNGSRESAVALYRRALGQVGSSDPRGQRALRRIEEFDKQRAAGGQPATSGPEAPGDEASEGEAAEDEAAEDEAAEDESAGEADPPEQAPSGAGQEDLPSSPKQNESTGASPGASKPAPGSSPPETEAEEEEPEADEEEIEIDGDELADEPAAP